MAIVEIKSDDLVVRLSTSGGIILGFWRHGDQDHVPLLRSATDDDSGALASGCYPLVPFANRVAGNRFSFAGSDYALLPNTEWDKHYLHGEGWQTEWTIVNSDPSSLEMEFEHAANETTPYSYHASQRFSLRDGGLEVTLSVTNAGETALPFGLGWHPYFPMTPGTMLFAPAKRYWTEVEDWLPGEATDIPQDVDFSNSRELPHRWVNNGFEEWSGVAEILWPERQTGLRLEADAIFRHAFVFVSDTDFDPSFNRDYFCFEPMSHLANGHNLPGLGDLSVLKPGEQLTGSMRMTPYDTTNK